MPNLTVLILEDEPIWLTLHKDQLEKAGIHCYATQNANEAIEFAIRYNVKIALIDEILFVSPGQAGELQGLQGRGVLRKIIHHGLDTKFIFITASPYNKGQFNEPGFWREYVSLKILPGVVEVINKQEIEHNLEETYERIINIIHNLNQEPHKTSPINWDKTPVVRVFQLVKNLRVDLSTVLFKFNFNFNINLEGQPEMSTTNINLPNSTGVFNINNQAVNGNQIGVQNNHYTTQDLEAAQEIDAVLEDLSPNYPIQTDAQKQRFAEAFRREIEQRPQLMTKIIAAIKSAGIEAFKQLCSHPAVDVALAAYEGWQNP
ncbi:response regulator [Nostoc sp. TCL26-01]|uniref:response regulator n=1 Tax=Nostoc sp. TCL26-01 TaxID=2576904 RepID=UPI0015BB3134|nr:response regulator [Nostoc sp. TCL26-01]QLE57461.1 response regulator [Nostoc sp. TCL26-01]